jgi:hypothetical protein
VDDYFCDFGYVAEGSGLIKQTQHLTLAARASQGPIFVVRRLASPLAQPLLILGCTVAWRVVLVREGEEVRSDGALVRLLETRQTERARLKEPR